MSSQIVSEQSMRLIQSREDVLGIVYEISGVFKPMIPNDTASVNLFRGIAEKKVFELSRFVNVPDMYTRLSFQRFTVQAALEIDAARREIEGSEPIDWSSNV